MLSLLLLTYRRGITWTSLSLSWLKVYGNRFINIAFDTASMFSEAFSQCVAGLAYVLTRKGGVLFDATFAVD